MFSKPLSLLTADDINKAVLDAVRESDVVEFKEALSAKGGRDAWHDGAAKVGDGLVELKLLFKARDELALYAGWILGMACNALEIVDVVRKLAGAPYTEFGLDMEIWAAGSVGFSRPDHATFGRREKVVARQSALGFASTILGAHQSFSPEQFA